MAKQTQADPKAPVTSLAQSDKPAVEEDYWDNQQKKQGKLFDVAFFYDWCKACGLCASLCPRKIILNDESGKPYIEQMDRCSGCRFCVIHCPDFAITVKDRFADRRRATDEK